jgi:uncharacterized membrane protein YccC
VVPAASEGDLDWDETIVAPVLKFDRTRVDPSLGRMVAAVVAFALGDLLGLSRDYWTILTVAVVFQTGLLAAISSWSMRIVGTLAGAAIGELLAAALLGPVALTLIISALAGGTLAVRGASPSVYVALMTPLVIVLLSISFPSGWALTSGRVVDTLLGSACALAATAVLLAATAAERLRRLVPSTPG